MIQRIHADGDDVLVEVGRSWRSDDVEIRNYASGSNRIVARVASGRVALKRTLGVVCPGIDVTLADLETLVVFLRWWQRRRSKWAAFFWTGAGHPPGWGGASAYYQPPGATPAIRVATKSMGRLDGEDFKGRDVRVRVAPPERVAGVANLEARLFRRGERLGAPGGEEIGGVYRCGELRLKASRDSVTVRRGRSWLSMEPGEHVFLERLLAVERA